MNSKQHVLDVLLDELLKRGLNEEALRELVRRLIVLAELNP